MLKNENKRDREKTEYQNNTKNTSCELQTFTTQLFHCSPCLATGGRILGRVATESKNENENGG